MESKSIAYEKAFKFSVEIVNMHSHIAKSKNGYILSKQFLRSGISVAANIKEAIYGQSKKDFISKLSIALKEASETEYWIELLIETDYLDENSGGRLKEKNIELIKILTKSLKTAKENI